MKHHLSYTEYANLLSEQVNNNEIRGLYDRIKSLKAKKKELCDMKRKKKIELQIRLCEIKIEIARLGI